MAEDVQSLLLDDHWFPSLLNGTLRATIRIGERPIQMGRLIFRATNGTYLPAFVFVEKVINTTLIGINEFDAQLAGYATFEMARDDLMLTYPEAKLDTPFTVIRFERV